jgi:hypothetical protein
MWTNWSHVAVVPQSVIFGCGLKIHRSSDITLTSTDEMFIDPLSICANFRLFKAPVNALRRIKLLLLSLHPPDHHLQRLIYLEWIPLILLA